MSVIYFEGLEISWGYVRMYACMFVKEANIENVNNY